MRKKPMLVNNERIVAKLRFLVEGMTFDPFERKDLLQESLLHLWEVEGRRPGQTLSWYLQSCRYHLQHYLARGRSVDSRKRNFCRLEVFAAEDGTLEALPTMAGEIDYVAEANVEDEIRVLSHQLNEDDRRMLQFLLDGLTLRDAAAQLGISFPTAVKRRRRIGETFKRLSQPPCFHLRISNHRMSRFTPAVALNFYRADGPARQTA